MHEECGADEGRSGVMFIHECPRWALLWQHGGMARLASETHMPESGLGHCAGWAGEPSPRDGLGAVLLPHMWVRCQNSGGTAQKSGSAGLLRRAGKASWKLNTL